MRLAILIVVTLAWATFGRAAGPRFYPDDPLRVDNDTQLDASGAKELELSETYDFLEHTFGQPGSAEPGRAVNVNTIDEVPDSSWFTNRIGQRPMSIEEIVRGPDQFPALEVDEWVIVEGKAPGGFQPGFLATNAATPGQVWQLEVDPPGNPEMATGAEIIGAALYHAFGYNTTEVHIVRVDPATITIAPDAKIRDASGERRFVRADLDGILRLGARDADGRYRMSAEHRLPNAIGRFKYYDTRPDDPNDIYPHEYRRELRANRVFAAWLNHNDSRAINTLDTLVDAGGRKHMQHYMRDFGSILGSSTRYPDTARTGHEYKIERRSSLRALLSFGFYIPRWMRIEYPEAPLAVGLIAASGFDPAGWKPDYPNPAFLLMQPDDAFWAARIVSKLSDAAIEAVVRKAEYTDPHTTSYLTSVLAERRDKIAHVWLNAVNPLVNVSLSADGVLTFENAAVAANAATPAREYRIQWSQFDNAADAHEWVGPEMIVTDTYARAPAGVLVGAEFVAVTVRGEHPEHPAWRTPVQAYFRRTASGWTTVGLFRG